MDCHNALERLFAHNRTWSDLHRTEDPEFFQKLARAQVPEFLWIGCSDSRVPANEIIGLPAGEVFVHRNVANLVSLTDFNCLSVVQYAVQVLKVGHIIVCGHYGCGGVQTALSGVELGIVNNWLSPIDELQASHLDALEKIPSLAAKVDKLCEINVITQVRNLCRSAMLKQAWRSGQKLCVHGLIYGLEDGILHDLHVTVNRDAAAETFCGAGLRRILSTPNRIVD
jgi:carbonic anhydrase